LINDGVGILLAFTGEVEVAHGGLQVAVAHVLLDEADVDPGFEQVSGVAVAKRVDADPMVVDAELF